MKGIVVKDVFRACMAGVLLLITAGCAHQISTPTHFEPVTLPGTGDSQDLLRAVAQDYTAKFPERQVIVPDSIGSDGGIKAVGIGEAPIGRVARYPSSNEVDTYGEFKYTEFARVPVAFVVSPRAGVKNLDEGEICAIYTGMLTNWKEVGGRDLPINVQSRPDSGSNMETIRNQISCFTNLEVTSKANFNLRNADLVNSMKTIPGAIGFMPLSEARLHDFSVVSLNGIAPHKQDYKLGIGLGFVYKKPLSPSMQEFVDYLSTAPAKKIMRNTGHLPVL
jgi:phosphate transport system substrate-binding protein